MSETKRRLGHVTLEHVQEMLAKEDPRSRGSFMDFNDDDAIKEWTHSLFVAARDGLTQRQWRPIETAPQGTRLLLCLDGVVHLGYPDSYPDSTRVKLVWQPCPLPPEVLP